MVIVSYKNCQVHSEMPNCKIRFVSLLFNRKLHVLEQFLMSFYDVVIKRLVKLLKKIYFDLKTSEYIKVE